MLRKILQSEIAHNFRRNYSKMNTPAMEQIVTKLKNGCKVVVLTGAGISCASGIPDFRSPGGLYDTLKPNLITATSSQRSLMRMDPTAVVDFRLFNVNQFPYLEVRRPFILGTAEQKWKATLSHFFLLVLEERGLLQRVYSQNIDGLDSQLALPSEKVVNLHGSLAHIECEFCGAEQSLDQFHEDVRTKIKNIYKETGVEDGSPEESSQILCANCHRPGVKPATVMYGRELPRKVWHSVKEDFPDRVDLMIVAGTSLTVSPANQLVSKVSPGVPRLLINREVVGVDLGLRFDDDEDMGPTKDAMLQMDCDAGFLSLAEQLGWVADLHAHKDKMCPASAELLDRAFQNILKRDV